MVINVKVHYDWAGNYGLLAMVVGAVRHLSDTTNNHVAPAQPPNCHTGIIDRPTQAQREEMKAKNNPLKQDWAVVTGWKKAIGENIRDAIDSAFYKQLKAKTYNYIKLWLRGYINHLD